ncbi:4Fe-4S binding protein [Pseudothauera nasutitermitis]|uniref:4Fe-4S binding protein n=1 Tax=Pseudothauera nasutitermitis TaxID=2565930 RepID=A0A4S4B4F2_9RHOO|nr:4Fe-4S binding protein [Pseudothauera nasutitermitis]
MRAFGDTLRRRQDVVRALQWGFVALYLFLLFVPLLAPLAPAHGAFFARVAHWAEALFWGFWWPAVILSMMLFGQFWCGVFCPDGALTEFASRRGLGRKIPPWMRRAALPLALFALIVVYEHLSGARHSHGGTLLVLGTVSLGAVLTGLLYGRGKRVWCRYLCPTASIFSMLARCAVLHFKVDREAWDRAPRPLPGAVDCPLLLDVRRLRSNEKCSMCGRCSGHRDAVRLAWRAPGQELATLGDGEVREWEAVGILFVLIGLFYGAMHWQGSAWHGWLAAALGGAGGWRGGTAAALLAILLAAGTLGGTIGLLLLAAARGRYREACRLAYGLIPLGGAGLMLGAMEHSFAILRRADVLLDATHLHALRAMVLMVAAAWSVVLGMRMQRAVGRARGFYPMSVLLLLIAYLFAPVSPAILAGLQAVAAA